MKGEKDMATATVDSFAQQSEVESSLHEQITALAYALWQERGCPEGSPEEDWFRPEKELRAYLGACPRIPQDRGNRVNGTDA
jgi:hypothetical protein